MTEIMLDLYYLDIDTILSYIYIYCYEKLLQTDPLFLGPIKCEIHSNGMVISISFV